GHTVRVPARNRLDEYKRKRDPQRTPEPYADGDGDGNGATAPGADASARFVVQEHHATRLHWDLRLEHEGVAASWAIPNGIPEDPHENRLAVRTEDHPLEYLEFEGDIPKGQYGAGKMRIWDRGTYETHKFDDAKVEVTFHGERLNGRYGLFALKKRKGEAPGKDWMIHRMDPPQDPDREPMPDRLVPMLAKPSPHGLPPDDDQWAYEIKWDGVRALAYSEPGRIHFESRNRNDISAAYPELKALNRALSSHRAILDGEIVAFDENARPSFGRLQGRMHVSSESAARRRMKDTPVHYVAFDLLWLDGHSLMELPYDERRARLMELELQGAHWQTPEHVVGNGAAVLAASLENGLEGVVAKRLDSPYLPGRRSPCWLKVKNVCREDVVVGGWLPGEGKRRERIGALLVGIAQDGRLRYAGRVGTGFTEAELDRLSKLLEPREDSPFQGPPKPPRGAVWVQPTRVAEVEFTEWTSDGMLRHPSYKGLREEAPRSAFLDAGKPLRDGVEVTVGGRTLKLTNLDKVLYPKVGFTKRDVIEYYVAIAPAMLAHLEARPLTRVRFPNGVEGKSFFEKNCPSHRPQWVRTASVPLSDKTVEFCVCDDLPTIVWLANLAALELHTQMHRAEALETPTMMVFDLDPGPPATIVECCRVALWLQGMFENLGLQAFPKTSGSKGLQVYVPLNAPGITYAQTKGFAHAVADLLESAEPDLVIARMNKDARKGKVFIDYSQNDEHKTTVCAYSLRARDRPTVSTPLEWDEVRGCLDDADAQRLVFDAADVVARFEEQGDLFAPVLSLVQEMPSLG
ncbi:MAG TPA: DNA ligase D, partial [Solirubrobacteraceae bacterium]|nr:DNA ligase D [Solirubrobacteraceae bacterium]